MLDYAHRQHRSDRRRLLLLALLLIVAAGISLCAGDSWIGPERWLGPDGQLFVWQIRLPRTVAVMDALEAEGGAVRIDAATDVADFEAALAGQRTGEALALRCIAQRPSCSTQRGSR